MRRHPLCLASFLLLLGAACGGGDPSFPDAGADQRVGDAKLPPGGDGATGDGTIPTGDGPCLNKCTKGLSQCVGAQIQTCNTQANGCTDWDPPKDCQGGKACNAGACPTCTDDCTYNNTQCSGTKVQKCNKLKPDGCYTYNTAEDCPGGAPCAAGKCPSCVDQCSEGKTKCNGAQVQVCSKQSSGCTDWGAPANCPGGVACTNDQCPGCTNKCTPNTSQCVGTQIKHCKAGGDGCYDWAPPESCPNGKSCVADTCPTCSDQCTINTTKCSGTQIQTCELKPTGCTDWSSPAACPGGAACANDKCPGGSCTPGELRCTGNVLEQCNASGQWQSQQICAQSCDAVKKQCVVSVTCTAGTRRCNGTQVQICNATGTAWLTSETCNVSCQGGLCTGACTPGAKRCNGPTPETCNTTGNAWTTGTACTTFCYKGECAQPSLTVDANANKQLDGELVFAGDVLIKNTSTVTVPTGKLIIRAKKFILDSTSSITVAATGDDPRGKGSAGGSKSCSASGYTASTTVGGGGGGFGATGTAGTATATYCSYYCYSCQVTSAGGPLYGIADDEAAPGASGGNCNTATGGKGGGMIAIYAEEIVIQGAITANGQSGSGCAGGGSGGAIVLRATQSLTFTGSAAVSGGVGGSNGAGAGALGVIKLLYGNTKSITGTTTGKVFASYMPPDDLSSSTHPDPARWYNDAFSVFEVAWSKPFTQSGGYYYVENQSYGFVPSPSNALYQTSETLQYPVSVFKAGANYVHLSVVGPAFDPSTIESRYLVQVNTTPPTVSSQSHPSSSTWYANNTPFLQWSLPKADENTSRFYWVLDRYFETIPDKSANVIPMNLLDPASSKRILLPVTGNGIWFFHVIAEDTMGYLTKAGATFRIQIGSDPGKGGVSGTITDGSTGSFLSGVTVTLNRGVHTATTTAQGAYAFTNNTVFAQDYEVRASKTGYKTGVQTVTVVSGQTATVNMALQPE
ncbi:MAG: carboxypeptidase-like regulatory domain-containing protein [Acidobacteriota bacterium]